MSRTMLKARSSPFENCTTKYDPSKDDKYADCPIIFFNIWETCENLKDLHFSRTLSRYTLIIVPSTVSIFAFLFNISFIYICICVIKGKDEFRRQYSYYITRSVSSIVGLLVFYSTLIIWKIDKLEKISIAILFTLGTWSFSLQAMSYIYIAINMYNSCDTIPQGQSRFLKNKYLWLFSVILSVSFGIFYTAEEYYMNLNAVELIESVIIEVAGVLFITYFLLIMCTIRKALHLRKQKKISEQHADQINTRYIAVIYRIISIISNCILTKFVLIFISIYCVKALYDLDDPLHPDCQRFLNAKMYIKADIFGGITLFWIILGMITDPLIPLICDFSETKPLLLDCYDIWKERLGFHKNENQEDDLSYSSLPQLP